MSMDLNGYAHSNGNDRSAWFKLLASQKNVTSLNYTFQGILALILPNAAFVCFTLKKLVASKLEADDLKSIFFKDKKALELDINNWLSQLDADQPLFFYEGWLAILSYQGLKPLSLLLVESNEKMNVRYLHDLLMQHGQMHQLLVKYSTDSLTGLENREHFDRWVRRIYERNLFETMRTFKDSQWCLALLDLDGFAKINQIYGSLVGDQVLSILGQMIRQIFRPDDGLFRYSGDCFAILMRESSIEIAAKVLDRFRQRIAEYHFPVAQSVTLSLGLTQLDDRLWVTVIGDAKSALGMSKQQGGNTLNVFESMLTCGSVSESQDWYGLEWLD